MSIIYIFLSHCHIFIFLILFHFVLEIDPMGCNKLNIFFAISNMSSLTGPVIFTYLGIHTLCECVCVYVKQQLLKKRGYEFKREQKVI